jgi:hypothetical protein
MNLLPGMNEMQSSWFRNWAENEWVLLIFDRHAQWVQMVVKRDTPATAIGSIFFHLQAFQMGWRFDHSVEWGGDYAYVIRISLVGKIRLRYLGYHAQHHHSRSRCIRGSRLLPTPRDRAIPGARRHHRWRGHTERDHTLPASVASRGIHAMAYGASLSLCVRSVACPWRHLGSP